MDGNAMLNTLEHIFKITINEEFPGNSWHKISVLSSIRHAIGDKLYNEWLNKHQEFLLPF